MMAKPTLVADGESILIHIPMRFKRRGGRKEVITPQGLDMALSADGLPQEALVVALAHRWQQMLDDGEVESITVLAERLEVDRSYVARVLRLTLLAPDIIEAILAGREPSGLSLARLVKTLPMLWREQRETLGFPLV